MQQEKARAARCRAVTPIEPIDPGACNGKQLGIAFCSINVSVDPIGYESEVQVPFGAREMVDLEPLAHDDRLWLRDRIHLHQTETGSEVAARLLADWTNEADQFVTVMPRDYRRVLEATERAVAEGRSIDDAVMEVSRG